MSEIITNDYATLAAAVKSRVRAAQYEALRAVNRELVGLYWDLGSLIADRQQEATWGNYVGSEIRAPMVRVFEFLPPVVAETAYNGPKCRSLRTTCGGYEDAQRDAVVIVCS